jgi:hypothetical protein
MQATDNILTAGNGAPAVPRIPNQKGILARRVLSAIWLQNNKMQNDLLILMRDFIHQNFQLFKCQCFTELRIQNFEPYFFQRYKSQCFTDFRPLNIYNKVLFLDS